MKTSNTIGSYLIERVYKLGVRHIFGVPGDFILGFDKLIEESLIQFINTCDEQGAGYAADAYARLKGLGVVCITYCVGGLKVANTTAQAYAEKSPVLVISGAPGMGERTKNPLLHHKVRNFDTQYRVFQELTVASAVLDNPNTAFQEIERVLEAINRYKRPGYIEIPRDQISAIANANSPSLIPPRNNNSNTLEEALEEAIALINRSQHPIILAGVEIHRFGLQEELLQLVEKTNIPVAETLMGKSVISELHPNYIGLYEGAMGDEYTRLQVESSDCLIMLGTFLSDINLGIFTANLNPKHSIYVTSEKTSIQFHNYEDIDLADMVRGLAKANLQRRELTTSNPIKIPPTFSPILGKAITVERLFQKLNSFLSSDLIVVADVGDALFAGSELFTHDKSRFFAPAYYASLGFAVPASIGIQLANPNVRPLVLVGDGAFQMTGMELSTIARYKLNPIIILLNNNGYGTERPICDGAFNDLLSWHYHLIPKVLGNGLGFDIHTEDELEQALVQSQAHISSFCLLDVHLDSQDSSPALKRLADALGKKVK
jgi:TPP-dependent 2-oxoacid decarboxylase